MRVLVTGCGGQVGGELVRLLAGKCELAAEDRASLDLARPEAIRARVRELRPQLILNPAAYTAVDRAESEPALARAVNAVAPGVLAEEARRLGALLVHYSTDYVFDGAKPGAYTEEDATGPMGVYGRTKLEGERAVASVGGAHLVLRTTWVYGPRGRNFLRTMLDLAAKRDEIRVVDDQFGAPTSSLALARATLAVVGAADGAPTAAGLERAAASPGLYHATATGETSWFGFAAGIFARWARLAPAGFRAPRVVPIPTSEYPTPVRRPANSRLDTAKLERTFGVRLPPWEAGLDEVLAALASG